MSRALGRPVTKRALALAARTRARLDGADPDENADIEGGIGSDHALSESPANPALAGADGVDRRVGNAQVLSKNRHLLEPSDVVLPVGSRIHE